VRIRPLEVAPFEREGRVLARIRDPLGLSPAASTETGWVVAWHDVESLRSGRADASVGAAWSRELLLEDETFRSARRAARERWEAGEVLPARGAGVDYEADPFALRMAVAGSVADDWDMPPPEDVSALWLPASGLRGRGALFGRGWAAVRHLAARFARVVLLAPVAAPLESPLPALDRPQDTPLGRVALDREALARLPPARGDEVLAHGASRVFERHALYLRLLLPKLPALALLVPMRADGEPPHAALAALAALDDLPGRTLWLAAADLSERIGVRGSDAPPRGRSAAAHRGGAREETTGILVQGGEVERLRALDAERVDAAVRLDADAWWRRARQGQDALARDTAGPLWLLLRRMAEARSAADGAPVRGSLLGYRSSGERSGLVSSACVVFH
jgi:AmmeMemoRadiSam system protein B